MSDDAFRLLRQHTAEPLLVYDGNESPRVAFPSADGDADTGMHLELGLAAAWNWRLYYSDAELNQLAQLFEFRLGFRLQREVAVNSALNLPVVLSPMWKAGSEYSVCFCYDEISQQHFRFWLLGVVVREQTEDQHRKRVKQVRGE